MISFSPRHLESSLSKHTRFQYVNIYKTFVKLNIWNYSGAAVRQLDHITALVLTVVQIDSPVNGQILSSDELLRLTL